MTKSDENFSLDPEKMAKLWDVCASGNIDSNTTPAEINGYRIINEIGEGGMGIVYLAEQTEPIKRRVALKIIKPGMDSKQVISRFQAEKQALALLNHPNIAHIYDAGTTKTGRPYFVMEYIKGTPVTGYCDKERLTIKQRLKLFVIICQAIQHAHQKGIIHRDIKPSNILITFQDDKPTPKIIDFGIAKATSQSLTEHTMFTSHGQMIGTPEYMSPEQADLASTDIDTRTDIYSLGIVLYELLTGTLPFEPAMLRKAAFAEIQRIIKEEDPPKPSTRLSGLKENAKSLALSRQIDVTSLIKSLNKELEWIPMKAMRKEPDQRYKTALEFAKDIENYLKGNPLIAGPESKHYKLKKHIKQHKRLILEIGIAALALFFVACLLFYMNWNQVETNNEGSGNELTDNSPVLRDISDEVSIAPSDGSSGDHFGMSISIDGDFAVVGADWDDDNGSGSGSVYVYKYKVGSWREYDKLIPSDGMAGDHFGMVSVSDNHIIVGASYNDGGIGSAYIYQHSGSDWVEQVKLIGSDSVAGDYFGFPVHIHGDKAMVGARLNDTESGVDCGSVYYFKKNTENWSEQQILKSSDAYPGDSFGSSICFDGNYTIVGAELVNTIIGNDRGAAYIFKYDGANWNEEGKLTASDGELFDRFGNSVSISGDYCVVGACGEDERGVDAGAAYVFKRDGTIWIQQAKLMASDGDAEDKFGTAVSILDGVVLVGSPYDDDNGSDSGSAYIFERSGTTWTERNKIISMSNSIDAFFGNTVSMSKKHLLIGSPSHIRSTTSGSAFIYIKEHDSGVSGDFEFENFETDPEWTSTEPVNIKWDPAGFYRAKVTDNPTGFVQWGYSPVFREISEESFTFTFDMKPVNPNWGTSPMVGLISEEVNNPYRNSSLQIEAHNSDGASNKFCLQLQPVPPTPRIYSATFDTSKWYHHKLAYDKVTETLTWDISEVGMPEGSFHSGLYTDVSIGSFNQFVIGYQGVIPVYGRWAEIYVDNIRIMP